LKQLNIRIIGFKKVEEERISVNRKQGARKFYDNYAHDYERFYSSIQRQKFAHIQDYIRPSSIIFDLGGGSGLLSQWVDTMCINFDISSEMLRQGLQQRSFQAVASDLEHLPIRSNVADQIVSLSAFQNTQDLNKTVNETKRIASMSVTAVITLLRKTTNREEIENILIQTGFRYNYIATNAEDYCYTLTQ